jgi:Prenyltransferase and squalene oxidase repeat
MRQQIELAIQHAADYLIRRQDLDGHWEEYALPVGASDAWVTAYIGLALHSAAQRRKDLLAGEAARRAAVWLHSNRPYPAGWGYNSRTGPDADSTAHALALLRATGLPAKDQDLGWLLDRWQPGGGFATFDGPEAWGVAHPDITAICFHALPSHHQALLGEDVVEYLRRTRRSDGSWPSYWWSTCFYSSFACLSLLRCLEPQTPQMTLTAFQELDRVQSAFDLAFVLGIAVLQNDIDLLPPLLGELLRYQSQDGGWKGAQTLRVTAWSCYSPWDEPKGKLYADTGGLISTATVLSILARV